MLGDLAALHGRHRRQRQLPGDVAGGVDVADVGDAVVLMEDVAGVVDLHAGGVEAEPVAVGDRADGEEGVEPLADRPSSHCTTTPSSPRSSRRAGTLVEADARREELLLEGGGDLGVLRRQHLLAVDHERDVAAERREHADELHPGDARADDHEVLGHSGGG